MVEGSDEFIQLEALLASFLRWLKIQWVKKYQPENLKDICIDLTISDKLRGVVKQNKSALIYGPVGCCKTCSVYALGNELNYEILEINASDLRNKEQI